MKYDLLPFLAGHPVFRPDELQSFLEVDLGLGSAVAAKERQGRLADLTKNNLIKKIRNGLYASRAVMEEAPVWLPYAVAGRITPDTVLGFQAALWFHLRNDPPQQLHVFSSRLEDEFTFRDWTIIPVQSKLGPASGQDPTSVPGIIRDKGRFKDCPLVIRVTTPERTLVDILDGLDRRPRKSNKDNSGFSGPILSDLESGSGKRSNAWPPPPFQTCWETLAQEDVDLKFEELLAYLHDHSRSKTTTAKVGFFLSNHKERFGVNESDLSKLLDLPWSIHRWIDGIEGTPINRWKLIVPNCLLQPITLIGDRDVDIQKTRLRPGIRVAGPDLRLELEDRFGKYNITNFRDGQESIIRAVLEGRDAIAILPTGAGKSLTYQFPSTLLNGPTLVISPLVSLIADQIREAREMELVAHTLTGKSKAQDFGEIALRIETGTLNLLFVSPEAWSSVLDELPQLRSTVAQIVVDEAHLINSWGQDFRFDYQKLGNLRKEFPGVPVLALTATATKSARKRIVGSLHLQEGMEVQKLPVKRPHLYLRNTQTSGDFDSRYKVLIEFLEPRKTRSGIIYCQSRADTEKLVKKLRNDLFGKHLKSEGITSSEESILQDKIQFYHAGMKRNDREAVQQAFLMDECSLMVATIAFGMGVNKKHVRFVAHFGSPPSIENYVQEVGRGGRDAFWAECLLIHAEADWVIWDKRLEKTEKRIMNDDSAKGRHLRSDRLKRLSGRRKELGSMKRFINKPGCLHRKIEKRYFDSKFDKEGPGNCGRSCDRCFSVQEHSILMEQEIASWEQ